MGKNIDFYRNILFNVFDKISNNVDFNLSLNKVSKIPESREEIKYSKVSLVRIGKHGKLIFFVQKKILNFLTEQYNFSNEFVNSVLTEYSNIIASHIAVELNKKISIPEVYDDFDVALLPKNGVMFSLSYTSESINGESFGILFIDD